MQEFLVKITHVQVCFSRFLNSTNGTKSRKVSHILWRPKVNLCLIFLISSPKSHTSVNLPLNLLTVKIAIQKQH